LVALLKNVRTSNNNNLKFRTSLQSFFHLFTALRGLGGLLFGGGGGNNNAAVDQLRARFNTLESQYNALKIKVIATDASLEQLMNKADKNEQDIAALDEKLNQLDAEMKKQLEIIESQVNDLMKELAQVDQRVTVLELNVTFLDTRLTAVEKDLVSTAETAAFFENSRLILEKFQNDWRAGEINTGFFTLMGKTIIFCFGVRFFPFWLKIL